MPKTDGRNARVRRTNDPTTGPTPREIPAGLPNETSIVAERAFLSPKGKRYRIIRTNETDPYDDEKSGNKRNH